MSDQFAGIMPIAGALLLPEIEDLWPDFLPNLAQTRVICVWGAGDIYDGEGRPSPHGGIAQLNRALRRTAEELKLPIIAIEDAHADHGSARPTMQRVEELLSYRRVAYPPRVQHTFRDVSQARAYWLEGQEWTGPQWGGDPLRLEFRDGEDPFDPRVQQAARLRAYRRCLGELSGTVEENRIRISRSHLRDVIIWLGDGLIDWEKPVEVHSGGRRIFNGRIEPDLYVCLSEAALSYDFQRLRWGGVSYRAGGRPRVLNKELAQWRDDP